MYTKIVVVLAGVFLFSTPVWAGNVTAANGQVSWQSTQCTAPVPPPSLVSADRMTPAEDMNAKITTYNAYAHAAQAYMDCVSNEAQQDADASNKAIIGSAQAAIEAEQKTVVDLGKPLQPRE